MKRMQPTAWFWIVAAAVVAVALFTVGQAYGQSAGAAAAFEGRPAMAGAQAGTGPMAGPPQGGLGPQSTEDPGAGIGARRDSGVTGPAIPRDPGLGRGPGEGELRPQRDRGGDVAPRREGDVIKRDRDDHGLQQQGESAGKAKRAGKRSIERSRRGVSGVDS
jgi:hypothetical protein